MTEQEAYRAIFAVMDPQVYGPPIAGTMGGKSHADVVECQRLLTAYRAAVRAETLREVRGVVEGIRIEEETWSWEAGHNAAISSALAALDALAQPEGTA